MYEQQHEKKVPSDVCPMKTLISLYSCTVWSVFVVSMRKLCIPFYPKLAKWRFWSDCANAQADLNLRWGHTWRHIFWCCGSNNWYFFTKTCAVGTQEHALNEYPYVFIEKYRIYRMYLDRQAWGNCVDPDEMPQNAASHQGLYCLPLLQQFLDIIW